MNDSIVRHGQDLMTGSELIEISPLKGRTFVWKERSTWFPHIEEWLKPFLYKGRQKKFVAQGPRENPHDDPDWLDFLSSISRVDAEDLTGFLADDLLDVVLRTYHRCRVEDAGSAGVRTKCCVRAASQPWSNWTCRSTS